MTLSRLGKWWTNYSPVVEKFILSHPLYLCRWKTERGKEFCTAGNHIKFSKISYFPTPRNVGLLIISCLIATSFTFGIYITGTACAVMQLGTVASLGLVSPGAATDGVTIFSHQKRDGLFLVVIF